MKKPKKYFRHRDSWFEDPNSPPTEDAINYGLSMADPLHQTFRELEDHLDSSLSAETEAFFDEDREDF